MEVGYIKKYLQTAYSDEKLAALLAHAQDGKLSYMSCCCFIGAATADHALQSTMLAPAHYFKALILPSAFSAESEFFDLGDDNKQRLERIIPLIFEEIKRRDDLKTIQPEKELAHVEAQ